MDTVAIDFETYYGQGYTLSSMTTEEYVRSPMFEAILLSYSVNGATPVWVPRDQIAQTLANLRLDQRAVLAHHAHFDALILSVHYGVKPKAILDTLGMARALHGANAGLSLAKLAERYGIGKKGEEVLNARGLRYADFSPEQLARYGEYSCNDTALCYQLGQRMIPQFSLRELQLNDLIVRMFTEPVLRMDTELLAKYADGLKAEKMALMLQASAQRADLMSNEKFADMLRELGVEPPMKISPTWLKKPPADRTGEPTYTYAFAKSDPEMQILQEHPDERVQILVEARLKNKTTIAEKGAERLISMAGRGAATVYLKYSGASGSHRLSGGDKFNWQSMKRGSDLRNATMAPPGHVCVVGDSSNIESRLLDWLAGQDDMVQVYVDADNKVGPDMYCVVAERIYKRTISKDENPQERQMGKVAKLGLGYGMGHVKFIGAVRAQAKGADGKPLVIEAAFAKNVVDIYRSAHPQVQKLWRRGDEALKAIAKGEIDVPVDFRGIIRTCADGLGMPGGLKILYPELRWDANGGDNGRGEWTFWNGKTREHLYGAKVIENCIQCLARLVVMEQSLDTLHDLRREIKPQGEEVVRWAHSVHDEAVYVVPEFEGPFALATLMRNMRKSPSWCATLPLNSEGGIHIRYGKAKT